ncbi:hypothetical protein [Haloarchaeobius amylolyticus]|uniref:hypothetical protein n=1 Tax=Haloarchaeobius amylolyticus TaxID=1198296 RepID=UPI00226EB544|nr:hypothetical protein [Haloarchaeobius amylolyticus]
MTRLALAILFVLLGTFLVVASPGACTERACPGETTGPTDYRLTGIDTQDHTVEYYDGCNWCTRSLVWLSLGVAAIGSGGTLGGVTVVRRFWG